MTNREAYRRSLHARGFRPIETLSHSVEVWHREGYRYYFVKRANLRVGEGPQVTKSRDCPMNIKRALVEHGKTLPAIQRQPQDAGLHR